MATCAVVSRSSPKTRPAVAVVLAMLLFGAACAQESDENPLAQVDDTDDEQPRTPGKLDQVVDSAIVDVEAFWDEQYPEVFGGEFDPVEGGYYPYGPDTRMPPCGDRPISYQDIAQNAFYCPSDDLIAWDQEELIPWLDETFGPFTIGIVFAHEYGHAIQAPRRADITADTLRLELQADCFAGAWTDWIADGNSEDFSVTEGSLDDSVAGMIYISDAPGTGPDDPAAHGSGFDRVGAFQDGFEQGVERCKEYDTAFLPIVEIPFSGTETETGGNLPVEELYTSVEANLNYFYEQLFKQLGKSWKPVEKLAVVDPTVDEITCDGDKLSGEDLEFATGYCEDENTVVIDGEKLATHLYDLGDFAVAAEIARQWTRAAQLQLNVPTDDDKAVSLQADCLTGVWADANFPQPDGTTPLNPPDEETFLRLSPGDLDEAIIDFLESRAEGDNGTAFERVDALRGGFVTGLDSCKDHAPFG